MKCNRLLQGCRHDVTMSVMKNVVDQLMKNIIMQANLLYAFVYLFFYIALFVLSSVDATVLELFPK